MSGAEKSALQAPLQWGNRVAGSSSAVSGDPKQPATQPRQLIGGSLGEWLAGAVSVGEVQMSAARGGERPDVCGSGARLRSAKVRMSAARVRDFPVARLRSAKSRCLRRSVLRNRGPCVFAASRRWRVSFLVARS
jgi:hypothetical protein